jgi:hypothetical protein
VLTQYSQSGHPVAILEGKADGSGLQSIVNAGEAGEVCRARWTPDERYVVFTKHHEGRLAQLPQLRENMAGTTRLELATSAVTAFNDMEQHGRHRKSLEVRRRQRYCVSRCVSRVGSKAAFVPPTGPAGQ